MFFLSFLYEFLNLLDVVVDCCCLMLGGGGCCEAFVLMYVCAMYIQ